RRILGVCPMWVLCVRLLPKLAPALLAHFDIEFVGRLLDPPPRCVALVVAHALDLVEAGNRVAHVAGIVQRLLALFRKCELVLIESVTLLFAQFGHSPLVSAAINARAAGRVT